MAVVFLRSISGNLDHFGDHLFVFVVRKGRGFAGGSHGYDAAGTGRIRTWVRESGIRWGADAAMRVELGLPVVTANTWDFGLDRLFLGYALPPGSSLYRRVAPYPDVEGSAAADLGALAELALQ